ncbi:MAG: hypothetical protein J5896_06725 [Alphaproteobacteria bacterium]|nr:hypothetical protein [Alphaproteobacteria bacterium]
MSTVLILVLVIAAICGIAGHYMRINTPDNDVYEGPATIIAEFTDEEGGLLCEFEKDGKKFNAVYGGDSEGLHVGDQVQIVWKGWYYRIPQAMDRKDYKS